MQLTKNQVIALLIGSTYAQTIYEFKSFFDAQQSISGQNSKLAAGQTAWYVPMLSLNAQPCSDNSECDDGNELCAEIYSLVEGGSSKWCFHPDNCGNMGRTTINDDPINNFRVNCPDAVTGVFPERVDVAALITNLENTILTDSQTKFSEMDNVFLTSKDNFMTGWWTSALEDGEYKWSKTEKSVIAQCTLDTHCEAGNKCAWWPDENNKLCQPSTVCGVEQTLAPFTPWTPTCDGDPLVAFYDTNVPDQKTDLLAQDILFKSDYFETLTAVQQSQFIDDLLAWRTECKDTILGTASVASCTEEERLLVLAERATRQYYDQTAEKRLELDDTIEQLILFNKALEIFNESRELDAEEATSSRFEAEKLAANYDSLTNAQKAVFLLDIVSWRAQISQACGEAPNDKACVRYLQIRTAIFDKMVDVSYWGQTQEDRDLLDEDILSELSTAFEDAQEAALNNLKDQDNVEIESFVGPQANFNTFVTIDAVKVKTSPTFSEAVLAQNAGIYIGEQKCGNVPAEIDEDIWVTVECTKSITANYGSISSADGIVSNAVEFKLAAEQDATQIGSMLFEANKPQSGQEGFSCVYDGVVTDENEQGTRPTCDTGLCCGHAFASGDEYKEDRTQVEVCGGEESVEYIYKPLWNSDPATWVFECIEGSSKIAATAAALILGMISMI